MNQIKIESKLECYSSFEVPETKKLGIGMNFREIKQCD